MKTLMAPWTCMNIVPSMHIVSICSMSQAAVMGRQEKIWTWRMSGRHVS